MGENLDKGKKSAVIPPKPLLVKPLRKNLHKGERRRTYLIFNDLASRIHLSYNLFRR
jgi:hypothetical protein